MGSSQTGFAIIGGENAGRLTIVGFIIIVFSIFAFFIGKKILNHTKRIKKHKTRNSRKSRKKRK